MSQVKEAVKAASEALETVAEMAAENESETAIEVAEETVSDNEVAIAAIEAEAEVEIASINAEARIAEAEAYNSNRESEEEWKAIINRLEVELAETRGQLAAMQETQSPLTSSPSTVVEIPVETVEEAAEMMESDLIQPSTSAPTSETRTEASPEKEEENLVPPLVEIETPTVKKTIRLI